MSGKINTVGFRFFTSLRFVQNESCLGSLVRGWVSASPPPTPSPSKTSDNPCYSDPPIGGEESVIFSRTVLVPLLIKEGFNIQILLHTKTIQNTTLPVFIKVLSGFFNQHLPETNIQQAQLSPWLQYPKR
jgi:hypothetical protein